MEEETNICQSLATLDRNLSGRYTNLWSNMGVQFSQYLQKRNLTTHRVNWLYNRRNQVTIGTLPAADITSNSFFFHEYVGELSYVFLY